jgi:hypothetical protein
VRVFPLQGVDWDNFRRNKAAIVPKVAFNCWRHFILLVVQVVSDLDTQNFDKFEEQPEEEDHSAKPSGEQYLSCCVCCFVLAGCLLIRILRCSLPVVLPAAEANSQFVGFTFKRPEQRAAVNDLFCMSPARYDVADRVPVAETRAIGLSDLLGLVFGCPLQQ